MKQAAIFSYFTRQPGPMSCLAGTVLPLLDKKSGYICRTLDKK